MASSDPQQRHHSERTNTSAPALTGPFYFGGDGGLSWRCHTGNVQLVLPSGSGDREAGRALAWREAFMPDRLALENNEWFGPEDIAGLTTAFQAALAKLGLVDRSDLTTLTLAKLIIELAKAGEREPERLCDSALKRLSK